MKTIAIFPGQASEYEGMFLPLAGREVFSGVASRIRAVSGRDICAARSLEDPLSAQLAVFAASVCYWRLLSPEAGFSALAGHSLGFYSALYASGALTFDECVRVILGVQEAIERVSCGTDGAMASIMGMDEKTVAGICAAAGRVHVANVNSSTQIVISGERRSVHAACREAAGSGALHVKHLPISYALHSPLMSGIEEVLEPLVRGLDIREPGLPVVSHLDAGVASAEAIAGIIRGQLVRKVRWRDAVRSMTDGCCCRFVEVGPSDVLSRLVRWVARDAETRTAEEMTSCQAA